MQSDSNVNMLNDVTNDLILKYDEQFNELYDKKISIDSSIMNKEEIILKENDEINNKNNTLTILQYTNIAVLLFGISLILYGINKISYNIFIIYLIFLIIVYLLVITFTIYIQTTYNNVSKNIQGAGVSMVEYANSIVYPSSVTYKCPAKCIPNPITNPGSTISGNSPLPTLRTDPQLDVWQYGDLPTDLYTSPENPSKNFYSNYQNIPNYRTTQQEINEDQPQPFFDTTYPSSTYYQCQWNGGASNNGDLPNVEMNKYSSIPCSYRPNFTEVARYICTQNPNGLDATKFNSICDNV